jgi:hypothetical protein
MRSGACEDRGPVLRDQIARTGLGRIVAWSRWALDIAHRPRGVAAMAHMDIDIFVVVVVNHIDVLLAHVACGLRWCFGFAWVLMALMSW